MKKLFTLLVAAVMTVACSFGLTACGKKGIAKDDLKVGLICLHDETSTYDKNFIDAFKVACENKGIKSENIYIRTNIDEDTVCYDTAADLADLGCNLIFADSFGHEKFMIQAAKEFKDVQFCHATGTKAHTEKLSNYSNAFASIFEGRYLAGYAAGLKLNTMTDKSVNNNFKVGYVGAYPYAEVKSGYTSWFLGLQAALSDGYTATMEVIFTSSWYDFTAEGTAAKTLISNGCVLISQHADSMGAPNACEEAGVPNVSYNGSTASACPNTFIVSSRINWAPYYEYCIGCMIDGSTIETDYSGSLGTTLSNGSVCLTDLGTAAAADSLAKIEAVAAKLRDGSLKVFDCSKFTVKGAKADTSDFSKASYITMDADGHLTGYKADVDDDGTYVGETEAVKTEKGVTYFAESEFRSAPYFDIDIDGISIIG